MPDTESSGSTKKPPRLGMSSEGKTRLAEFVTAVKRFEEAVQSGKAVHPSAQQVKGTKIK